MGWYDAFYRPSVVGPVLQNTTSNKGSAAKNFGDAFVEFGKSMREVDKDRIQENKSIATTEAENARKTLYDTQNTQAGIDNSYNNTARTTKADSDKRDADFTNAFNSLDTVENLKLFKDHYADNNNAGYGIISPNSSAALNKKIEHMEDRANTSNSELAKIQAEKKALQIAQKLAEKENKINLLKIKNEKSQKSKEPKPLSITAQTALSKLIDEDNYVLTDKGKPEINEDGEKVLKKDISPAFHNFMKQEIFSYMSASKSDKNYENAKKKAIESWNELEDDAPSKAQDIAFKKKKELDDRTVLKTIKDYLNPDKVDGKEIVVSEENTNTTPQKNSMFFDWKNSR